MWHWQILTTIFLLKPNKMFVRASRNKEKRHNQTCGWKLTSKRPNENACMACCCINPRWAFKDIYCWEKPQLDVENGTIQQPQINPGCSENSWADTWDAVGCRMWSGRKKRGILLVEAYREAFLQAGVTANHSVFTKILCWVGLTMQHMQNVNVI